MTPRPVATRDPRPSTFTAGFPRAPQRHRERLDTWREPSDGRPWIESALLWLAPLIPVAGLVGLVLACVVLGMSAGPGR